MKSFAPPDLAPSPASLLARAERQIARERAARLEAEAIAEKGLRELYESRERVLLLQRITEAANKATNVDTALGIALAEFGSHMGCAIGHAYLRENEKVISCESWYAVATDDLTEFVSASENVTFASGIGLPGRVMADPRPHWIEDLPNDGNFPRAPAAARCGLATGCAFPVLVGDEVVAVLEFFMRRTLPANDEILSIMTQVGTQLGRVVERERARRDLLHDALHDAMTGLPNRVLLNDRLANAFRRVADRHDEQLALLVIDLDGLKAVNDTLGHHAGDALLINVAQQLRDCLAQCEQDARSASQSLQSTVARTGGDEFVVLLDGHDATQHAARVAKAIHAELRAPTQIEDRSIRVSASVGIAHCDHGYAEAGQLMRDADLAMYHAKAGGPGRTVVFCESLGAELRSAHALEQELREALQRREFELYYQPIVSFDGSDTVQGFEALLRWRHPSRGLLSPDAFIELAEHTGLIVLIGDWVLNEACRALAGWRQICPEKKPFVSVNISPKQFLQPEFAERVLAIMLENEIEPVSLRLEVTEGVAIIDAERTRNIINKIRSWGVKTSLDDFGTGFSSLSYLQTLPFDAIKIDRSFVSAMDGSNQSEGIVRAILDLARTMQMTVIAEGVETAEQERKLIALGCEFGQGYRYGVPVDQTTANGMLTG